MGTKSNKRPWVHLFNQLLLAEYHLLYASSGYTLNTLDLCLMYVPLPLHVSKFNSTITSSRKLPFFLLGSPKLTPSIWEINLCFVLPVHLAKSFYNMDFLPGSPSTLSCKRTGLGGAFFSSLRRGEWNKSRIRPKSNQAHTQAHTQPKKESSSGRMRRAQWLRWMWKTSSFSRLPAEEEITQEPSYLSPGLLLDIMEITISLSLAIARIKSDNWCKMLIIIIQYFFFF